jgi:hypothetical protein
VTALRAAYWEANRKILAQLSPVRNHKQQAAKHAVPGKRRANRISPGAASVQSLPGFPGVRRHFFKPNAVFKKIPDTFPEFFDKWSVVPLDGLYRVSEHLRHIVGARATTQHGVERGHTQQPKVTQGEVTRDATGTDQTGDPLSPQHAGSNGA